MVQYTQLTFRAPMIKTDKTNIYFLCSSCKKKCAPSEVFPNKICSNWPIRWAKTTVKYPFYLGLFKMKIFFLKYSKGLQRFIFLETQCGQGQVLCEEKTHIFLKCNFKVYPLLANFDLFSSQREHEMQIFCIRIRLFCKQI